MKIQVGDVFAVPIDGLRVGYGQIMLATRDRQAFLAGAFESLHPVQAKPDLGTVTQDRVLFAVRSVCDMVLFGLWPVVGRVLPNRTIATPRYRVHVDGKGWCVEDFDGRVVRKSSEAELTRLPVSSYVGLQSLSKALQAHHGLREWTEDDHEIEYDKIVALQDIRT